MVGTLLLVLAAVSYFSWERFNPIAPIYPVDQPALEVPAQTSLTGEQSCLPHRNTQGPVTMECALGIKADDGFYYALDLGKLDQEVVMKVWASQQLTVEGLLVPIEQLSSDSWQKYQIEGVMRVDRVEGM